MREARAASQAQLRADYDVPAELAYVLVAVGITATIVREGLDIEHDELVADIDAYLHEKGRPSLRAVERRVLLTLVRRASGESGTAASRAAAASAAAEEESRAAAAAGRRG